VVRISLPNAVTDHVSILSAAPAITDHQSYFQFLSNSNSLAESSLV